MFIVYCLEKQLNVLSVHTVFAHTTTWMLHINILSINIGKIYLKLILAKLLVDVIGVCLVFTLA